MFRFSLSTVSPLVTSLLVASTAFGQEEEAPPAEETPPAAEAEAEASDATEPAADANVESSEEAPPEAEKTPAPEPATEEPAPEPQPAVEEEAVAIEAEEVTPETPAEAPEPSLLPLKVGTHSWSRFEVREGYDNLGVSRARFQEGDQTVFRARLTFETNPLQLTDTVQGLVYFAPQASGSWGTQGIGGTIGEANMGIYEGYVYLKGETLEAKIGRQALNYGDALILGNLDWHQAGRAHDGLLLRLKPGAAKIDAFVTQQAEGHPASNEPLFVGDSYLWGVYGQFGAAIAEGLDLDGYVLGRSLAATDITTPDPDPTLPDVVAHKDGATFVTLGARVKQKVGMIDYRVEAGLQVGKTVGPATENIDKFAYQADGELGLSFGTGFRVSAGGALASGNDPDSDDKNEAWDELYPTTHKWFGLMDVIGFRTNIASANLKFKAPITESTIAEIHGHLFARMEDGGLGQTGDDKLAGYEVDAMLMQKIGKFAYTRGLYGIFLPNGDHYDTSEAAHFGEIQAGLKF
jgi:hypothetical protein